MSARQNPNDFLKTLLGRPVVVKLNSGVDYRGVLSCLDGELAWQTLAVARRAARGTHTAILGRAWLAYQIIFCFFAGYMNIALEQTEEYVHGQLKNKYGDTFIRGNNVLYISTQRRR